MAKITWLGHGSWKIVTKDNVKIYLDPFMSPVCSLKSEEEAFDADIVCVTHGHIDHIGFAPNIAKATGCDVVTIPEVTAYMMRHGCVKDDSGDVQTGGSVVKKGIRFNCVYACHAADIWCYEYKEDGKTIMPGSGACGFVISAPGEPVMYFAGDTGVFGDMKLIQELYHPEIAVLPVGGKYTMGIKEANLAVKLLGSKVIIPGHYNTFPAIMRTEDELKGIVEGTDAELRIMKPGEVTEV